jgi:hypothetical protein
VYAYANDGDAVQLVEIQLWLESPDIIKAASFAYEVGNPRPRFDFVAPV